MKRRIVSLLLVFALAASLLPVTAFAEPADDFGSNYQVRFDGEDWFDCIVRDKDEPVTFDDLHITVEDHDGNIVDPEKYSLTVTVFKGWDEENDRPDLLELHEPFRLTDYELYAEQGYGWYSVSAVAKDDSGYQGSTRPQNFNIRHLYSFNEYCVNVDFDWDYHQDDNPWGDHNYFVIPSNRLREPQVWNRDDKRVDPEYYTITYYRRNTEEIEHDDVYDPEYLAQRYPEVNPLDDLPEENGSYFAVVKAVKDPYYGATYVDFDVTDAVDIDLSECEIKFSGEGWKVYPIDRKEDTLSLGDLDITVIDRDGDEVPEDAYDLVVGTSYWSEEEDREVFTEMDEPFKLTGNDEFMESGFGGFAAYAVAKENSGYTGQTEKRNFMIWHKYSFNYFGANVTFGEGDEYKAEGIMSWHDRYVIPANRIEAPVVHGITWEDEIDPDFYEIQYFVRHDELLPELDPEHPENTNYDENRRYSEEEPLEGLPTVPGTYFVRVDGKDPYYGTSYVDFDVTDPVPENDFSKDVEIRFRGKEEWAEDYLVDSRDQKLSLDDLDITLVKRNGDLIPSELYDLHIGVQVDYDDENHRPVIEEKQEPFGTDSNPRNPGCGWCMYAVYAVAKDGSGYVGETRIYEFILRDKHTLDRDSGRIDFGEAYLKNAFRSWHYNYVIPSNRIDDPDVYNCLGEKLDSSEYTLTYFERGSDDIPFDDPDREEKIYPEEKPLSGLPTDPGSYFVRLDGKDPYYGTSYVDFDVVEGFAVIHGEDRRYYDGDTIYLSENSEIDLCFDTAPFCDGLIPRWRNDLLKNDGFTVNDDPSFFEGDDFAYAHIGTGDLKAGDSGTLYYSFYRTEDVFDRQGGMHWDTTRPFMSFSVRLVIMPQEYDYLLGDADGDGDISIVDVTIIQRHLAGLKTNVDPAVLMQGDVDGDGELSMLDAIYIQRRLANIRISYDVGKPMNRT